MPLLSHRGSSFAYFRSLAKQHALCQYPSRYQDHMGPAQVYLQGSEALWSAYPSNLTTENQDLSTQVLAQKTFW